MQEPHAYLSNIPARPLGALQWRRNQLAARGYKVVVVTQAEWQEVGPELRGACLRMSFREAGVVLPASVSSLRVTSS